MNKVLSEAERLGCIRFQAEQLIKDARALNVNVRITGVPLQPLAMRNYAAAIEVYAVRPDVPGWVELGTLEVGDLFRDAEAACKQVWFVLRSDWPTDTVKVCSGNNPDSPVFWDATHHVYKLDKKK